MVRSFGLGIPGTRNVYIGMSVKNTGNKNVNFTSSRNSEPKRTHHYQKLFETITDEEVFCTISISVDFR